jgi:hypothetical protein
VGEKHSRLGTIADEMGYFGYKALEVMNVLEDELPYAGLAGDDAAFRVFRQSLVRMVEDDDPNLVSSVVKAWAPAREVMAEYVDSFIDSHPGLMDVAIRVIGEVEGAMYKLEAAN